MDNLSQDSANLNKPQGGVKYVREPRTEPKATTKYDPYAILNKVRGRKANELYDRELHHTRSVDVNRFDPSPKNRNSKHFVNKIFYSNRNITTKRFYCVEIKKDEFV